MKYITQFLCLVIAVSGIAQRQLPIYENFKIVKEYKMDLGENKVFVEAPFAKPELELKGELQDKKISKITYLYSFNNNYPEFGQNALSDKRYFNLKKMLSVYNLSDVEWETNAQAGCGEVPCSEVLYHGFVIEFEAAEKLIGHHLLEDQVFTINNDTKTTIEGKDGTKLEIPANAFVDAFGNPVQGTVEITLKEAVTTEDIVLGGMYTMTEDGAILESKGMINVTASQGNTELELNSKSKIKVELPTTYEEGYKYFEGEHVNGELKWMNPVEMDNEKFSTDTRVETPENELLDYDVNNENDGSFFFDVVEAREMMDFYPLKANYEKGSLVEVTIMNFGNKVLATRYTEDNYLIKKGLDKDQIETVHGWFEADTVEHEKLQWVVKDFQSVSFEEYTETLARNANSLQNNIFSMKKTGWANCDKFSKVKAKDRSETFASFDVEGYVNTQVSLVIPRSNVCVKGSVLNNGTLFFPALPKGKKAIIIASTWKDDQYFFATKEITIGSQSEEVLIPERTTKEASLKKIHEKVN